MYLISEADKITLEDFSHELRKSHRLHEDAPISMHQLLKGNCSMAYIHPMDDNLLGMAIKQESGNETYRFMMINSHQEKLTQRHTACHELYHLLYQEATNRSYEDYAGEKMEEEELKANYFASCLMLPKEGIKSVIGNRSINDLSTLLVLLYEFRCPPTVLFERLYDLDFIERERYANLLQLDMKAVAVDYGYNLDIFKPTDSVEVIGDYNQKARILFEQGRISQNKYYSLLRDMDINGEGY